MKTYPEPKLRWYYLPAVGAWGDGYAMIVLGDNGYFSAISDYGSYAYFWPYHGMKDFREFFAKRDEDWSYMLGKLCPKPWPYDGAESVKTIKERILTARRQRYWDRVRARMEWERVTDCNVEESIIAFHDWYLSTTMEDAAECCEHSAPPQAVHFCKVTLARFSKVIRAELAAERAAPAPEKGDAACRET
jgi:hypothetical protein